MKKTINLTVGTQLKGNGGVATVLNVLKDGGFFDKWHVRLVPSHTQDHYWMGLNRLLLFAKCLLLIVSYHLFYKVGVVHIHMASRWSFQRKSLVVRLVKLLGGKVILHLHGAEFREFYNNECDESKQVKIRKTFNNSDSVVVLSTQWLDWVQGILDDPSKAEVIYNAVSPLDIDRQNSDSQLILFLGRLGHRKGVGELIDAFAALADDFPKAHMALGGDGDIDSYRSKVAELGLSDRVAFLGWVAGDDKLAWLKKAGIYALPSYNEGFPMGVLEAMSAHIPVLASTAGGIPDAITSEEEGVLIEAGDTVAIEQALRQLLSDQSLAQRYAQRASEKFMANFSPHAVFPKLDRLYERLTLYK